MKDVPSNPLAEAHRWKHLARWHAEGFYVQQTEDTADVPVRLFLSGTTRFGRRHSLSALARYDVGRPSSMPGWQRFSISSGRFRVCKELKKGRAGERKSRGDPAGHPVNISNQTRIADILSA